MKKRQKIRKALIFTAVILFPITMFYYSPYVILRAASHGIVNGSMLVFFTLLLFAIFGGRLFCGYFCAGGGFAEMAGCVNKENAKLGKRRYIKYVIWVIWLGVLAGFFIANGGIAGVEPLYLTDHGISLSKIGEYPIYYLVVAIIFLVPLIFGRRAFCHYFCWIAPFMNLGMKIRKALHLPGVKLEVEKDKCIGCKKCDKACPMGLGVYDMVQQGKIDENECSMCAECIDTCPKNVISYKFKR